MNHTGSRSSLSLGVTAGVGTVCFKSSLFYVIDTQAGSTGSRGPGCCLLLQYLIQSCARGGRRILENMCYEIRPSGACVD